MSPRTSPPEQYHIHHPTPHVPNSRLPVLIYRDALPLLPTKPHSDAGSTSTHSDTVASADANASTNTSAAASANALAAVAREAIERNHWYYGGIFKTYWRHHFHSVTHECYAVVAGRSRLLLGVGPGGDGDSKVRGDGKGVPGEDGMGTGKVNGERGGVEVEVGRGDIIILPAGVSHCSITSRGDYEYLGLYPEGSPKYDNNFCKAGEEETRIKAESAKKVPIPDWDPIFGHKGPLYEIWSKACNHGS